MPASCAAARPSAIWCAMSSRRLSGDAAAIHLGAERIAFDQLRHQVLDLSLGSDVVDGQDVGVIQGAGGDRFLGEAPLAIGVQRRGVVKDLDRDEALQPGIAAAIHLPHAAGAERADDLVRPESRGQLGHLSGKDG